jgi:hypothetical protein
MWQEQSSLFGFKKFASLHQVDCLQVKEILQQHNCVGDV